MDAARTKVMKHPGDLDHLVNHMKATAAADWYTFLIYFILNNILINFK